MENKINIAELLKDCPRGMELDCTMYEDVYFDYVDELNIIHCYIQYGTHKTSLTFNQHGTPNSDIKSKCVIFPKYKTTWEGFEPPYEFEDGDVLAFDDETIVIFKDLYNSTSFHSYCHIEDGIFTISKEDMPDWWRAKGFYPATEEQCALLFRKIKEAGYHWNPETKTLEKLIEPKFKVGDKIRHKTNNKDDIYEISAVYDDFYGLVDFTFMLDMKYQDQYELVPNKFDINTLIPFESKVLVRHNIDNKWCGSFFSHIDDDFHSHCYKYVTIAGKSYPICIPYEGNEHLLGTTDDCDEYYKNW